MTPLPWLPRPASSLASQSDDVAFSHILGTVRGRDAFYGVYRVAGSAWDYKV